MCDNSALGQRQAQQIAGGNARGNVQQIDTARNGSSLHGSAIGIGEIQGGEGADNPRWGDGLQRVAGEKFVF